MLAVAPVTPANVNRTDELSVLKSRPTLFALYVAVPPVGLVSAIAEPPTLISRELLDFKNPVAESTCCSSNLSVVQYDHDSVGIACKTSRDLVAKSA